MLKLQHKLHTYDCLKKNLSLNQTTQPNCYASSHCWYRYSYPAASDQQV